MSKPSILYSHRNGRLCWSILLIGNAELTINERKNILSVALKNVVGTRTVDWRVVSLIEKKKIIRDQQNSGKARNYKVMIEKELKK